MKYQRSSNLYRKSGMLRLLLLSWMVLATVAESGRHDKDSDCDDEDSSIPFGEEEDEEEYRISSECAAVLLLVGGAAGGMAAPFLSTQLLASLGFTSNGIAAGSLASFWQSTMPLIPKGSLFSMLQSVTMAGAGQSSTIGLGGAFVSAGVSSQYLESVCAVVDEAVQDVAQAGGNAKDWTKKAWYYTLHKDERLGPLLEQASTWAQDTAEQAGTWAQNAADQAQQQASQAWTWSLGKAREKAEEWAANEKGTATRRWGRALNELLKEE